MANLDHPHHMEKLNRLDKDALFSTFAHSWMSSKSLSLVNSFLNQYSQILVDPVHNIFDKSDDQYNKMKPYTTWCQTRREMTISFYAFRQ